MIPLSIQQVFPTSSLPRFNFGVWKPDLSETCLLGRQLQSKGKTYYDPEVSSLLFVKFKKSKIIQEKVIWKPEGGELLEDPRALVLGKNKVLLGLTAVLKVKGKWVPYPAVSYFNDSTLELGQVSVIKNFGSGKNTTPLKGNLFLFRPGRREFYHKFLVFQFNDGVAAKLHEILLPRNLPWGKWKVGTTAPPIWITRNKALFFLAGINFLNNKHIYSIGRSFLEIKKGRVGIVDVDCEPIITRDMFQSYNIAELHPKERSVVYLCGTATNADGTLDLYVNVGDRNTLKVTYKLSDLL